MSIANAVTANVAANLSQIPDIGQLIRVVSEPLSRPIKNLSLLRQSLLFAELSSLSYYSPEEIAHAIKAIGFEDYQLVERESVEAYILSTQHDCVVVFRGTEPDDFNDIRTDVDAILIVAETVGKVHRGFKREADRIWEAIEPVLRNIPKPLWFTGHSLGGALATISAGRCVLSSVPSSPEGLFTFGSPRVGNRRFINFVKLKHYRWVNNNDIVTRLPPRWLGYRHAGRELYLDARGRLRKFSMWRKLRDRWLGFFLSLRRGKIDHVHDHLITNYIEYLTQEVQAEEMAKSKRKRKNLSEPISRQT